MGWFGGSAPSKVSKVSEIVPEPAQQQLLEDLPPKFEDVEPRRPAKQGYGDVLSQIKLSDFTLEHYASMPCFREAMITGFQAMGVLGVVTFLIHKNPSRSANWAVGGFFLGNLVGWEQCRSLRRKSFQTMEKARQVNQEKNVKKWENAEHGDDQMQKWRQVQDFEAKGK